MHLFAIDGSHQDPGGDVHLVERLLTLAEQHREVNARLLRVVEGLAARVEVLELERLQSREL